MKNNFCEDGHYYPNYKKVKKILTKKYGFRYTGIGDNAEECFYKAGVKPESIYIHTMFCSYSMNSHAGGSGYENRPHDISFQTEHNNHELSFAKLCNYLDKVYLEMGVITMNLNKLNLQLRERWGSTKKLRPCDCKDAGDTNKLEEAGIHHNDEGITVIPNYVLLKMGHTEVKIGMNRFKMMAEWYLAEQEVK